jgi:integrase
MSDGIRWAVKHGRRILLLDFYYFDSAGYRQRFRRVASMQSVTAARSEAARLMALAAATGSPVGEGAPQTIPTFRSWAQDAWAELHLVRHRPATRKRYLDLLGQGILDHFGALRLDQIGANDVLEYTARLAKRARPVQSRPHTSLVSTILRDAVRSKVLAKMPELPAHQAGSEKLPDCPSSEEVLAILGATRGWLRLACALAAYAGLRSGEVRALEVRDLDLRAGLVHVRRAISGDEVVTPKGKKERKVPIAPELLEELRQAVKGKLPLARVVLTKIGTTPSRQGIRDDLARRLKSHGLRHRSFHALRHHFCSSLLRRGASLEAVRIVAGHEDIETTARYLHAQVDEVAAILNPGPRVGTASSKESKRSRKHG